MSKYSIVHSVKVATEFFPETFGRLTTLGPKFLLPVGNLGKYKTYQVCSCVCSKTAVIAVGNLKSGVSQSCGCLQKERVTQAKTIHGMQQSSEYNSYMNMKERCRNSNRADYPDYGGRGIRVCDRWLEPDGQGFLNFLADVGPRPANHTIERKQVNGNYCPENCCWATPMKQARNRRNNTNLTFNGKTQCLSAWAEELGYTYVLIRDRLRLGWSVEKALTTPARTCNAKKNT